MAKEPAPSTSSSSKAVVPFIPASQSLPELTVGVIILGSILAAVLGAANAYLGLFAGMTVSASIPAAVVSMALLRPFKGNILQNNLVQTSAASGEGLAAGVIFTLPALIILGVWSKFSYVETAMIAGFGGLLGVLFTIPLRRALIIDQPLQFPEGVATAEVLKVGASGAGAGLGIIGLAALVGGIGKLGAGGLKLFAETASWAGFVTKKSSFYIGSNLSPALIGVGFIVGLNVALVIFAGAVLNRWIAIPLFGELGDPASIQTANGASLDVVLANGGKGLDAETTANVIHGSVTRYLGVGAMLVGGFYALFRMRSSLLSGVRAGLDAYKRVKEGGASAIVRTEHDMPMNFVLILIGLSVIPLFFIFNHFVDSIWVSAVMAVLMLIAGFLFSAVASYMAGLVGSSNNPVSGITIATILTSALLLLALGVGDDAGPVAAILIGGVVCCAASIGADNVQDLKCGQLVGSTPWKQQVMQIVGVIVAASLMAPILNLLHKGYGIGSEQLSAPQANLMASVSKGVFLGGLPKLYIGLGAAIAVLVIIVDTMAQKLKWGFRVPVMAFAVGVYLPFDLSTPILFGGLIAWAVNRHLTSSGAGEERRATVERNGLLFSAGLITGEALMGVVLAITAWRKWDISLADWEHVRWPGILLVAVAMALTYRAALKKSE
jgi:putative OPT family oligopeptide transporter